MSTKRDLDLEQKIVERTLEEVSEDTSNRAMEKLEDYGVSWRWSTGKHMMDRLKGERKEVDDAKNPGEMLKELLDEIWTATMLYDLVKNGRRGYGDKPVDS